MKKIVVLIMVLMVGVAGMGQSIRKVKIGDVDAYVKKKQAPGGGEFLGYLVCALRGGDTVVAGSGAKP